MNRYKKIKIFSTWFLTLIVLILTWTECSYLKRHNQSSISGDYVVLLHGLGRTNRSMSALGHELSTYGLIVLNIQYPSKELPIPGLADYLQQQINQLYLKPNRKIHFVTHSMGGIVLRYYLKYNDVENLGRVVMLVPPNQGSRLVEIFKDQPLFHQLFSPAARQLGTDSTSIPNRLGPVQFELGVIAGDKSLNPFYSMFLPEPNDGTLLVENTKVKGMDDFLIVHQSHSLIVNSEEVFMQIIHFLKFGKFSHEKISGK